MTENIDKMICPYCGAEMNRHAEKLLDPRTNEETRIMDPDLGGLIEEFHSCPGCGKGASRPGH